MADSIALRSATVQANGLDFGILEAGSGPLALCLHGFPDTAHTWRHLHPGASGDARFVLQSRGGGLPSLALAGAWWGRDGVNRAGMWRVLSSGAPQ